ncbi:hypothetical protein PFISCL1PPCAC_28125 [Pristionchus fissidentatus]|uniref:C2H2-type domain-containing protein n=1 Tax=Pristionchus fissidentatus TaxID=1538716 RepID=A0AAV5WZQ5_9BILA|nr:hypothetical protein PFISCL1PPCAC_28125 [Pristionchus fissidentatus]
MEATDRQRKERMTNIVKCLDALSKVEGQTISHPASILARLFYNLEESEGTTIDEQLLNELKTIVYSDQHSTIDGMVMNQLAKSFTLYMEGLISRNSTVIVPSIGIYQEEPSPSDISVVAVDAIEPLDMATMMPVQPVVQSHHEESAISAVINNVDLEAKADLETEETLVPIDLKTEDPQPVEMHISPASATATVIATAPPANTNLWRIVDGTYVCNNCPRFFDSQRGMLGHAKRCFKNTALQFTGSKKATGESIKNFDYNSRGIRSLASRTCPYCEVVLSSCHMVEHHSRKEHMDERTEVYGCSQCGRWCVTVMALIKHWDKHADCPNGHLVVRKPCEGSVPKNRGKNKKPSQILFACGNCGKGFLSRLGVKYHVLHVCKNGPILDIVKLLSEGIQFVTTATPKGFNLAIDHPQIAYSRPPRMNMTGSSIILSDLSRL